MTYIVKLKDNKTNEYKYLEFQVDNFEYVLMITKELYGDTHSVVEITNKYH